jgi:hypothetical protein
MLGCRNSVIRVQSIGRDTAEAICALTVFLVFGCSEPRRDKSSVHEFRLTLPSGAQANGSLRTTPPIEFDETLASELTGAIGKALLACRQVTSPAVQGAVQSRKLVMAGKDCFSQQLSGSPLRWPGRSYAVTLRVDPQ